MPRYKNIIWRCMVCDTKTNGYINDGSRFTRDRILCPGRDYPEHYELEPIVKNHLKLDKQIKEYEKILQEIADVDRSKSQSMMNNLYSQKELLNIKINKLREAFSAINDVKDLDTDAEVQDYWRVGILGNEWYSKEYQFYVD